MSALIVFLPPPGPTASAEFEYALTRDGSSIADHGVAPAALLPAATGAGVEVVAVVPATALSWHRVELPKGLAAGSPRLRAVLEGLLEDQLLDEPEALHFALQPHARNAGAAWAATCDRAWLASSLQALDDAGRPVTRIVPEFAPEGEAALHAVGDPEAPMLVLAGAGGVTLLPLSTQSLSLLPSLPEGTPCVSEPQVAAAAEQVLQRQPVLRHPAERWLRSAQSEWDLAQFEFSRSGRARAFKKIGTAWADLLSAPQWKPARWGALLLVLINLAGLNAWAWRERAAMDDKREAIRRTLTTTFPQVRVVVDAPVQMEREVAALRQSTGATSGNDLEAMLGVLAAAAPPQRPVSGVEFSNGELRVRGLALTPDEAASVGANLRSQGYTLTPQGEALVLRMEVAR